MTDAPHPLTDATVKEAEALWVECRELTKTACIARLSLALAQARRETWEAAALVEALRNVAKDLRQWSEDGSCFPEGSPILIAEAKYIEAIIAKAEHP